MMVDSVQVVLSGGHSKSLCLKDNNDPRVNIDYASIQNMEVFDISEIYVSGYIHFKFVTTIWFPSCVFVFFIHFQAIAPKQKRNNFEKLISSDIFPTNLLRFLLNRTGRDANNVESTLFHVMVWCCRATTPEPLLTVNFVIIKHQ